MFTSESRERVLERVLEMAKADHRITGGALVGSGAAGSQDEWSDIDITFGVLDGIDIGIVLDDWTEIFSRDLGALHYWDLPSGPSIYRVFLLPDGLEVDVSVTPAKDFGARGPRFRQLFGTASRVYEPPPAQQPDIRYHVGLGWHHILHARSSIERGKPWRAEYWIGEIRNHLFALACLRLGEESYHGRGIDRLPASVTGPATATLVRSLDEGELRRALGAATSCFLSELKSWDPALYESLKPLLLEFGDTLTK
jgi:hypothetical protein